MNLNYGHYDLAGKSKVPLPSTTGIAQDHGYITAMSNNYCNFYESMQWEKDF